MLILFAILSVLWITWGTATVLAALSVRKCARRYELKPPRRFSDYQPPIVLVVPIKGVDLDLETAIANLCNQVYPDYRLICVVESTDDPAHDALREQLARHPHCKAELLVAGRSLPNEGQKVHNLLRAIEPRVAEGSEDEVWVFADSDAAPGTGWLTELVGPLQQHWITGITTGYRWMIPPENKGIFAGFWSHVASVINSSVACFYGYDKFNHAWGGSMAMRRSTALDGELIEHWRGALSDDYQATRMCRATLLRVYFVPRCLVPARIDYDGPGFFEFARRQYVITRTHAPWMYYRALAMHAMFFLGYVTAWVGLVAAIVVGPWWLIPLPAITLAVVFAMNQLRAGFRRRVVRYAFGDETLARLKTTLQLDRWATPVWMTLHFAVLASALFTRTIDWRGRRYRINGPQRVTELDAR